LKNVRATDSKIKNYDYFLLNDVEKFLK